MNVEQGHWGDAAVRDADGEIVEAGRSRRAIIIGCVLLLIAVAAAVFMFRHKKPETASNSALPAVSYFVPGRSAVAGTVTGTGTLSARRMEPVGVAGEGGMVSRVLVDAGTWVHAGETLATVDPSVQAAQVSQMQAQISSAEANAKLAQSQLDRAQALVARGFISKADIDQRTATRDAANASVQLARAQFREQSARLGRLDIRAPSAGLILSRNVESGQIVSSGSTALFTMAMDGELEMQLRLAQQDLSGLHVGQNVQVTPVGSSKSFPGVIWQVAPVIDATSRQGTVRVKLAYDPALRPGGFATASLTSEHMMAPILPESAVQSDAQGNYVYVIDASDKAQRRPVTVGNVSDAGVAIATGLNGTERVVYSAGAFLTPGEKVMPELRRADGH
jgi:HlyD family secretion protein